MYSMGRGLLVSVGGLCRWEVPGYKHLGESCSCQFLHTLVNNSWTPILSHTANILTQTIGRLCYPSEWCSGDSLHQIPTNFTKVSWIGSRHDCAHVKQYTTTQNFTHPFLPGHFGLHAYDDVMSDLGCTLRWGQKPTSVSSRHTFNWFMLSL